MEDISEFIHGGGTHGAVTSDSEAGDEVRGFLRRILSINRMVAPLLICCAILVVHSCLGRRGTSFCQTAIVAKVTPSPHKVPSN